MTLSAGATGANAQFGATPPPLALDPSVARQGTALLVTADASVLSSKGQSADSVSFALARGMRVDSAARERLCARDRAARSACPASSRIGFGRFVVAVRGFELGSGGDGADVVDRCLLGDSASAGDAASVVLTGRLLGASSVVALLEPALGTRVPSTSTTVGRLVRLASGKYGIELHFAKLPVELDVTTPITATPARLELALSAVRRVRQDFVRRVRVRTLSGYEVRRIPDHRLIGHHLLRTPRSCNGSWPLELRVGFPGRLKRTASPCRMLEGRHRGVLRGPVLVSLGGSVSTWRALAAASLATLALTATHANAAAAAPNSTAFSNSLAPNRSGDVFENGADSPDPWMQHFRGRYYLTYTPHDDIRFHGDTRIEIRSAPRSAVSRARSRCRSGHRQGR